MQQIRRRPVRPDSLRLETYMHQNFNEEISPLMNIAMSRKALSQASSPRISTESICFVRRHMNTSKFFPLSLILPTFTGCS